jgi:hypothetical protein
MTPAALRACAEDILAICNLFNAVRGQHGFQATVNQMHYHFDCLRERLAAETPTRPEAPDENARLRKALHVALLMLEPYEPKDSRAVSNEFVALATVDCGIDDKASWDVLDAFITIAAAKETP